VETGESEGLMNVILDHQPKKIKIHEDALNVFSTNTSITKSQRIPEIKTPKPKQQKTRAELIWENPPPQIPRSKSPDVGHLAICMI
jgi:myosin-crossreactive antigen